MVLLSGGLMCCRMRGDAHQIHTVMHRHVALVIITTTTITISTYILTTHASATSTAFDVCGIAFTILNGKKSDKKGIFQVSIHFSIKL